MSDNQNKPSLSYKDAGVDIDAGNDLVERIKGVAKRTRRPEVMAGLGGFGALFEIPKGYDEPVLVSGTDGVGTKLKLAMEANIHDTIGIDLVAMCVNDLVVAGAEPLFFLDYYATGKLDVDIAANVVEGIGKGCEQSGCSLIGGETAEMPGMYEGSDYDLAGFCVGIAEKSKLIDGTRVSSGDHIIGMKSSGPHSNGYSLIRKIVEVSKADLSQNFNGQTLGQALLEPTRIYVKPLLEAFKQFDVKALAHITGGGFLENIPRVLPENTQAKIDTSSWELPDVFKWLQENGNVETTEMYRTFNCGVGMVVIVPAEQSSSVIEFLNSQGEETWLLGVIENLSGSQRVVMA